MPPKKGTTPDLGALVRHLPINKELFYCSGGISRDKFVRELHDCVHQAVGARKADYKDALEELVCRLLEWENDFVEESSNDIYYGTNYHYNNNSVSVASECRDGAGTMPLEIAENFYRFLADIVLVSIAASSRTGGRGLGARALTALLHLCSISFLADWTQPLPLLHGKLLLYRAIHLAVLFADHDADDEDRVEDATGDTLTSSNNIILLENRDADGNGPAPGLSKGILLRELASSRIALQQLLMAALDQDQSQARRGVTAARGDGSSSAGDDAIITTLAALSIGMREAPRLLLIRRCESINTLCSLIVQDIFGDVLRVTIIKLWLQRTGRDSGYEDIIKLNRRARLMLLPRCLASDDGGEHDGDLLSGTNSDIFYSLVTNTKIEPVDSTTDESPAVPALPPYIHQSLSFCCDVVLAALQALDLRLMALEHYRDPIKVVEPTDGAVWQRLIGCSTLRVAHAAAIVLHDALRCVDQSQPALVLVSARVSRLIAGLANKVRAVAGQCLHTEASGTTFTAVARALFNDKALTAQSATVWSLALSANFILLVSICAVIHRTLPPQRAAECHELAAAILPLHDHPGAASKTTAISELPLRAAIGTISLAPAPASDPQDLTMTSVVQRLGEQPSIWHAFFIVIPFLVHQWGCSGAAPHGLETLFRKLYLDLKPRVIECKTSVGILTLDEAVSTVFESLKCLAERKGLESSSVFRSLQPEAGAAPAVGYKETEVELAELRQMLTALQGNHSKASGLSESDFRSLHMMGLTTMQRRSAHALQARELAQIRGDGAEVPLGRMPYQAQGGDHTLLEAQGNLRNPSSRSSIYRSAFLSVLRGAAELGSVPLAGASAVRAAHAHAARVLVQVPAQVRDACLDALCGLLPDSMRDILGRAEARSTGLDPDDGKRLEHLIAVCLEPRSIYSLVLQALFMAAAQGAVASRSIGAKAPRTDSLLESAGGDINQIDPNNLLGWMDGGAKKRRNDAGAEFFGSGVEQALSLYHVLSMRTLKMITESRDAGIYQLYLPFFLQCPIITNDMWSDLRERCVRTAEDAQGGKQGFYMGVLAELLGRRPGYAYQALSLLMFFATKKPQGASEESAFQLRDAALGHIEVYLRQMQRNEPAVATGTKLVALALAQADDLKKTLGGLASHIEKLNLPAISALSNYQMISRRQYYIEMLRAHLDLLTEPCFPEELVGRVSSIIDYRLGLLLLLARNCPAFAPQLVAKLLDVYSCVTRQPLSNFYDCIAVLATAHALIGGSSVDNVIRQLFGKCTFVKKQVRELGDGKTNLDPDEYVEVPDMAQQMDFVRDVLETLHSYPVGAAELIYKILRSFGEGLRAFVADVVAYLARTSDAPARYAAKHLFSLLVQTMTHCRRLYKERSALYAPLPPSGEACIIPGDIRMMVPVLGLLTHPELRDEYIPALVRLYAISEEWLGLNIPIADDKRRQLSELLSKSYDRLLGAINIRLSNTSFLSLAHGNAAYAELQLQELVHGMCRPIELPPVSEDVPVELFRQLYPTQEYKERRTGVQPGQLLLATLLALDKMRQLHDDDLSPYLEPPKRGVWLLQLLVTRCGPPTPLLSATAPNVLNTQTAVMLAYLTHTLHSEAFMDLLRCNLSPGELSEWTELVSERVRRLVASTPSPASPLHEYARAVFMPDGRLPALLSNSDLREQIDQLLQYGKRLATQPDGAHLAPSRLSRRHIPFAPTWEYLPVALAFIIRLALERPGIQLPLAGALLGEVLADQGVRALLNFESCTTEARLLLYWSLRAAESPKNWGLVAPALTRLSDELLEQLLLLSPPLHKSCLANQGGEFDALVKSAHAILSTRKTTPVSSFLLNLI